MCPALPGAEATAHLVGPRVLKKTNTEAEGPERSRDPGVCEGEDGLPQRGLAPARSPSLVPQLPPAAPGWA